MRFQSPFWCGGMLQITFLMSLEEYIGLPPLWNAIWNPMYMLKKSTYIIYKNVYIFCEANRDSIRPIWVKMFIWRALGMDLRCFPTLKCDLQPYVYYPSLWKYVHSSQKYVHFLEANETPLGLFLGLNIHLRNLGNGFESFSYPEIRFGTLCTSLKKICTFLTKIHVFLEANWDPIRSYLGLNIHLGNLDNEFKVFAHPKIWFGSLHTF